MDQSRVALFKFIVVETKSLPGLWAKVFQQDIRLAQQLK